MDDHDDLYIGQLDNISKKCSFFTNRGDVLEVPMRGERAFPMVLAKRVPSLQIGEMY